MDTQRLVAFIVFSLSMLLLWQAWQDYHHPKAQGGPTAAAPARSTSVPSLPKTGAEVKGPVPQAGQTEHGPSETVKTDLMTVVIDAHGGDLRSLTLTKYRRDDDPTEPFQLFEERPGRNYFAQSGFIGAGLPTHKTVYQLVPGDYTLQPGQDELRVPLTTMVDGVEVQKTYVFHRGSYVIDVQTTVHNTGQSLVQGYPYFQFVRHSHAPEGQSAYIRTYTGPAVYTEEGKFQKVTFSDIAKDKEDYVQSAPDGWVGMVQHHFVAVWLSQDFSDHFKRDFYTRSLGDDEYSAGMILPAVKLAPSAQKTVSMRLYAGPQEIEKLEKLAPGLKYVVDYGWLTILAYPIFLFLNLLHGFVGNWGVAIILLTVIIKLAFYPLSASSYKSMAQMRKLAPRLQQLKERYGDDRQKLHEAMMKIYKEEKINPLGGCLPILVQIPVFIALYWVLLGAVELRQAPFIFWIKDLSEKDPYYILPVIMAFTMFIQQRMSPKPPDPVQAKVMMFMPIVFSVMFLFFPAGLVLYWLVNNVVSILQQWRINHVIERAGHGKSKK
jgi:YidC/Oxa1 family membrane protein insertase